MARKRTAPKGSNSGGAGRERNSLSLAMLLGYWDHARRAPFREEYDTQTMRWQQEYETGRLIRAELALVGTPPVLSKGSDLPREFWALYALTPRMATHIFARSLVRHVGPLKALFDRRGFPLPVPTTAVFKRRGKHA